MIKEIRMENYKSVQKLKLNPGRITVLIGENGCGKSNILEAIALASAAAANKLDNEFLVSRGIRVTDPRLMRSAFNIENIDKEINISVNIEGIKPFNFPINKFNSLYDEQEYSPNIILYTHINNFFIDTGNEDTEDEIEKRLQDIFNSKEWRDFSNIRKILNEIFNNEELEEISEAYQIIDKVFENKKKEEKIYEALKIIPKSRILYKYREKMRGKKEIEREKKNEERKKSISYLKSFIQFLIFSPENPCLRVFEEEGQIVPLGIRGEGLFKLLKVLNQKSKDKIAEIRERLRLIDWFGDFDIPENPGSMERSIRLQDRYIDNTLDYFDQKSTNEGFLFLLFYFALFMSKDTPKFFAVDNIDASLNPKLCSRLVTELVELSKKYDKQAIFTTHNPAVLDGLNLDDEEQRLFVVYRNKAGHTKLRRILKPETVEGQEPVKLSEAFLRGYIGGLPKNF